MVQTSQQANMRKGERVFNLLLSTSMLTWAVLGIAQGGMASDLSPTKLSITALHICVALLVLMRSPLRKSVSNKSLLTCLPALLIGGWEVWTISRPRIPSPMQHSKC